MHNITFKDYTLLSNCEHKNLLSIRNDKIIREHSFSKEIISLSQHILWIDSIKKNTTKRYFAIFDENTLVGGINIFYKNDKLLWGFFFDEKTNVFIKAIVPIYFLKQLFIKLSQKIIYSEVLETNYNALSFNKSLGFKEMEINNDIILLSLDYDTFVKKQKGILFKGIVKKMKLCNFEIKGLL